MKRSTMIHVISGFIVVSASGAWLATGREGYTRWPNAKLAQSDAPAAEIEDDLFADIGFETNDESTADVNFQSRFALGLAPGGIDPKHLPSVATAAAIAIVVSSFAGITEMNRRRQEHPAKTQHTREQHA